MTPRRLFRDGPPHVAGYRTYGTPERLLVRGRALADEGHVVADPSHSRWRNFREALKRFDANPVAHARVRAVAGGGEVVIEADDEGFVHGWLQLPRALTTTGWHPITLTFDGAPPTTAPGTAHALVPSLTARYGVISDLDDTVLQSRVATPLHAARLMLFENARTRLPFAGVAAFYRALVAGESGNDGNPIFYVSSSPWNVHGVLADFLDAQGIPLGPLLLRDWDLNRSLTRNAGHKAEAIDEILAAFPAMPFLLVGDTSQEDPEIYAEVVRRHPGRIRAIYIRDVGATLERRAAVVELVAVVDRAGTPLVLAEDTGAAARHAAERGWIDRARLGEISEEKREDEGAAPGKVEQPGPVVG